MMDINGWYHEYRGLSLLFEKRELRSIVTMVFWKGSQSVSWIARWG